MTLTPVSSSVADTHVAPLLPATAAAPEPARKVNFFVALLLFWILPKRYGPHLAVGSWMGALLAHGLSIVTAGVGLLVIAISQSQVHTQARGLREQAAQFVLEAAARSSTTGGPSDWIVTAIVILALPGLELGVLLLAILIMPWYAGGDRAGSVFKRSLKSVYWSSTIFIPLAVVAAGLALHPIDPDRWLQRHSDIVAALVFMVGTGVPLVLIARMLLVGGTRYVGPPDGPAFAPREPQCEGCGYLIVGLPVASRCPECGMQVAASLPGGRRRPTVWQANEFKARGLADALRLQWVVLADKDFFKHLPVHTGLTAARHFWWVTWCLMLLAALLALHVASVIPQEKYAMLDIIIPAVLAAVIVPLLLQSLIMFAACLLGQLRYGIRDYRSSAVVCYYASPIMWPVPALTILALLPGNYAVYRWLLRQPFLTLLEPSLGLNGCGCYQLLIALAFLALLLYWLIRLSHALNAIRHANV